MGLPETLISFKSKGATAITRSSKGIVGLILKDDTAEYSFKSYTNYAAVESADYSAENYLDIERVFLGKPKKVFVMVLPTATLITATELSKFVRKRLDYFTYPKAASTEKTAAITYFASIKGEYVKLVLADSIADNEMVINCTMGFVNTDGVTVSKEKFTARVAGILAGMSQETSITNYQISEASLLIDSEVPEDYDKEINEGKLVLIDDGDKIKVARGVNSLTTLTATKGKQFKKIKIVECLNIINRDIADVWDETYSGKLVGSYTAKILFIGAVNIYLKTLTRNGMLNPSGTNAVELNLQDIIDFLQTDKGLTEDEIAELEDQEIKEYDTGSYLFLDGKITPADVMEDLSLPVTLE